MSNRPKIRFARTDTTLFVFDDETAANVEKQIAAAMARGEARVHSDGRREWITEDVVFDSSKEGSEAFTWNVAGTKVKHEKVRHIHNPKTGELTHEVIGAVFREF